MQKNLTNNINLPITIIILALSILAAAMIFFPREAYASALLGLDLWWEVVTPALLPFFFISEILLELNISRYLTRAMTPLMGPLFSLPGAASLPVALGFCSGFPSGAAITASLRRRGEITREEGTRLICFTNNAGPLYISVAVASGLLNCSKAAAILAASHYGSNILIGVLLGLRAKSRGYRPSAATAGEVYSPLLPDPGRIVKAAASRAAANITSIGCLMIFFSVLNGFFTSMPINGSPLFSGAIQGFWEMSLGVHALAESELALTDIIPAVAAILGFGGVSVQTQVLTMIGDTDIRFTPFLLCRLFQAFLAYLGAKAICSFVSLPAASFGSVAVIEPSRILIRSTTTALAAAAVLFGISLAGLILLPLLRKRFPPDRRS